MFNTNIEYNAINILLAKAIPALSKPAGIASVGTFGAAHNIHISTPAYKWNGWVWHGSKYKHKMVTQRFQECGILLHI